MDTQSVVHRASAEQNVTERRKLGTRDMPGSTRPSRDLGIGYIGPAGTRQKSSISESLTVHIRHPGAICVLEG